MNDSDIWQRLTRYVAEIDALTTLLSQDLISVLTYCEKKRAIHDQIVHDVVWEVHMREARENEHL